MSDFSLQFSPNSPAEEEPFERFEEAGYEMANLYPETTGLPMTVWISPKLGARHDARVKVCQQHGDRMNARNLAVMSVRPKPELLHGDLSSADVAVVRLWIELNHEVLIDIWDGRADPVGAAARFERV